MSDKREKILAVAKSLFIELGINGTTIAEIAKQAGIAKGSVYSYFKSKQDIVIALMNQLIERGQQQLENLISTSGDNNEALIEDYIRQELTLMTQERALNQAIAMDDSLMMNEDMVQLIQSYRQEYYQRQLQLLQIVFGKDVTPWQMDLLTILNGAFHEYGLFMTLDNADIDVDNCAKIIATSLKASLTAFQKANLQPALTEISIGMIETDQTQSRQHKALRLLTHIQLKAESLSATQKSEVDSTCQLIEQELNSETPNSTLLRALIANLAPYGELHRLRIELADVLDVAVI